MTSHVQLVSSMVLIAAIQTQHVPALQASLICAGMSMVGWLSMGSLKYVRGELPLKELIAMLFLAGLCGFCVYAFIPVSDFVKLLALCVLAGLAPLKALGLIKSKTVLADPPDKTTEKKDDEQ